MPQTREELAAKKKIYYQENKQRFKSNSAKHYQENRDEILRYRRNHPNGIRTRVISDWKKIGLICEDYELLYSNYISETHCDFCRVKFGIKGDGSGIWKCMDHSHQTGLFRNFLCNPCNLRRGE